MIGWLVGIPLTVIVLVVVILLGEIPKDGVTRAAAYKAAALCGGTGHFSAAGGVRSSGP